MLGTKIFATIAHLIHGVLLLGALDMGLGSENSLPVFLVIYVMGAFLTLIAVWRSPAQQDKPFGRTMRVVRATTWGFHIVLMTAALVFTILGERPWFLVGILPSLIVCAVLLQKPTLLYPKKWFDDGDDEETALRKLADYYARHKDDVDFLDKECARLLIEVHFVRAEIAAVGAAQVKGLQNIPYAVIAHLRGETAKTMAIDIAEVLRGVYGENNPEVFTKHMHTGEDLTPDSSYDTWYYHLLGHTRTQRLISLMILFFVGCTFYAGSQGAYLMSEEWGFTSIGISCGLAVIFCRHRMEQARISDLRTRRERFKLKKWDVIWLFPVVALYGWMIMVDGVGATLTRAIGQPHETVYYYTKTHYNRRLTIYGAFWSMDEFCLDEAAFNRLQPQGRAAFNAQKSWFGEILTGVRAGEYD